MWVFKRIGQQGWRKLAYLGFAVLAEPVAGKSGPDGLRVLMKDGVHQLCEKFAWQKDGYHKSGTCTVPPPAP